MKDIVPVRIVKAPEFGTTIKKLRFIFYPHSKKVEFIKNAISD